MHFPQSHVAFGGVYCGAHLWKWLGAPHTAARLPGTCHSFASRDPMFSYFGQKVKPRDKPRKLLFQASKVAFSLDKATTKV